MTRMVLKSETQGARKPPLSPESPLRPSDDAGRLPGGSSELAARYGVEHLLDEAAERTRVED